MIIDDLSNAEQYICLHPLFKQAFGYIQSVDLQAIEPGKFEINGDQLYGIVSNKPGKTSEESLSKFECHDRYIDIQLCVNGKEEIGWKPRSGCKDLKESYNSEKDVSFFRDTPDMYFQLKAGQFAIFFPGDVLLL
jgi:biofilm protein TabA